MLRGRLISKRVRGSKRATVGIVAFFQRERLSLLGILELVVRRVVQPRAIRSGRRSLRTTRVRTSRRVRTTRARTSWRVRTTRARHNFNLELDDGTGTPSRIHLLSLGSTRKEDGDPID